MGRRPGAGSSGLQIPLNLVWISAFLAIAPLFINDAIGPISPLFLLLFGGLLVVRSVPQAVHDVARFRWLLIYPAYAVLSVAWSNYPGVSIRHSVQLVITVMLAIVVARCLTAKGLHRFFFLAFSIAILISIAFGNHRSDGIALGIFNSKKLLCRGAGDLHPGVGGDGARQDRAASPARPGLRHDPRRLPRPRHGGIGRNRPDADPSIGIGQAFSPSGGCHRRCAARSWASCWGSE